MKTIDRILRRIPFRYNPWAPTSANTPVSLDKFSRGSSNLEIFKFGMYIMFPIGWMYYFGTNLENRFSVPGFWPDPESTNKFPTERKEQVLLLEELKKQRLERRRRRLEAELEGGAPAREEEIRREEERAPPEILPPSEGIRYGIRGLEDMKQEQENRKKRKMQAEFEEMSKGR